MAVEVTLQQVRDAHAARDPDLVRLFLQLMTQDEPPRPPRPEGEYSFGKYLREINSRSFRRRSPEEQAELRQQKLASLEAGHGEPLSDKLRSHELLMELWNDGDTFSRRCLLSIVEQTPLAYGPFRALKRIFKQAEQRDDTEMLGALAVRFDMALDDGQHGVSRRTLSYLVRRGWRHLRRLGESFPAVYVDAAVDFLVRYRGSSQFYRCWIFNQLFFHECQAHTRTGFNLGPYAHGKMKKRPKSWLVHRAFSDLWRRTPRPLFALLERAQSDIVRQYAADALRTDFRAALREVEPDWVARLVSVGNPTVDKFVVWILDNVPRFEQAKFRELGLHDAVIQLFRSEAGEAKKYATNYARTHARDLPVETLVQLVNSGDRGVRKLGIDLIQSRDPRKEIGLDVWGQLLASERGSELAADALRRHFGARELTPEWFGELLISEIDASRDFAQERLAKVHSIKQLGWEYFADLIERMDPEDWSSYYAVAFLCEQIEKLAPWGEVRLRRLLLNEVTRAHVEGWINEGKLKASDLGVDFLKQVAYEPAFQASPEIAEMRGTRWGRNLNFYPGLAESVFRWLQDVRQFLPSDLGFEWLLELVRRSEPMYHNFAVETLTKQFLPADFAANAEPEPAEPAEPADGDEGEVSVDLGGDSFLFTGKLNTMSRSEAKGKVTAAGGANSSSVNKKLDYLVIGDEGSPLYGQGRKGSKQTKAEQLNEEGAGIHIISETAFLQMLAGEQREFSADAVQDGCQRLWSMMVDAEQPDAPLARFARTYIRRHHPGICLAETDRPVDPGAEMPDDFMSFERFRPLFSDRRKPLRDLALEMAKWEFARWSPPIEGLIELCEAPYDEVRSFVATALTCEDLHEHRRYRVDPGVLTADAVYSFCESRNAETRSLGMKLIDLHSRLQVPEELYRLTESPDGKVRGFVIRTFWSLYRARGTKPGWKPTPPPEQATKKRKDKRPLEERIGAGTPARPDSRPAEMPDLNALLRRMLFEVPPGRPPKRDGAPTADVVRLKPMPARQAKLKLIETLRDLAVEDGEFAQHVLPLLREFKQSRGDSERAACLVAVTRIEHAHPELRESQPVPSA